MIERATPSHLFSREMNFRGTHFDELPFRRQGKNFEKSR